MKTVDSSAKPSAWRDAIGPLFTIKGIADEVNLPVEDIVEMDNNRTLVGISTLEGDRLYPVQQVGQSGMVLPEVGWIRQMLSEDLIDPYMLAAWLNHPNGRLEGATPWKVLDSEGLTDTLKYIVLQFRTSLLV